MSLYDDLKEGLEQAISIEQGKTLVHTSTYTIKPVTTYSNSDIKRIRDKAGMTQKTFAAYLGVSPKTIEAWELGRTHPTGPAYRLLEILDSDKIDKLDFITKS